jgi:hypothetical protein
MHAIVSDLDMIRLFSSYTLKQEEEERGGQARVQSFTFESFEWWCWVLLAGRLYQSERSIYRERNTYTLTCACEPSRTRDPVRLYTFLSSQQ